MFKVILRIGSTLIWLGFLIAVGAMLLFNAASRVGEHKSSSYGSAYAEFQRSWGGEIGVILPKFYLTRSYTETEYNTVTERNNVVKKTENFSLVPSSMNFQAELDYGEQERGWLIFNAFETTNLDQYKITNSTEHTGPLVIELPKPINANLIHNYQIFVGDDETGLNPTEERMVLLPQIEPGQETSITVTYATKGMDVFKYNLSGYQSQVIGKLQATLRLNTPQFGIYRFGLPHTISTDKGNSQIAFNLEDFATTQDLGITFSSKQMYLNQIETMLFYSPLSLVLYLLVILTFSQIRAVSFNPLHYLFIGIINVFYFLFVAYLVRFFGVEATFGIAALLTTGMFMVYCPNVLGKSFTWHIAGPYLFGLTVLFSLIFLMPIFRGLLFVSLIFLIFLSIMIAISRSDISQWPLVKEH